MTIQETVFKLIAKNFKVPVESITLEQTFKDDLNADSLDTIEFFIDVEDEYHLDIDIEGLQGTVHTVGDALKIIESLVSAK
jgi:acyl carrier protein